MTDRIPRTSPWQREAIVSIEGLSLTPYLDDHSHRFYLEPGEVALSVELYADGTGIVKVRNEDGWESIFDVYHEETGP